MSNFNYNDFITQEVIHAKVIYQNNLLKKAKFLLVDAIAFNF